MVHPKKGKFCRISGDGEDFLHGASHGEGRWHPSAPPGGPVLAGGGTVDEGRRLAVPPRGLAGRPGVPRMLGGIRGCILSEWKEYTPRPPKKNSGRDFDFPPRPSLKRPKEGLRASPLETSLGLDERCGLPRRPVGPSRNDNRFLSFRGAKRRGNPHPHEGSPQLPRQRSERGKSSWSNSGFCPMTSLFSTGHTVRRSQQSPARAPAGAAGSLGRTV